LDVAQRLWLLLHSGSQCGHDDGPLLAAGGEFKKMDFN